jgi:YD repeat-containing protein
MRKSFSFRKLKNLCAGAGIILLICLTSMATLTASAQSGQSIVLPDGAIETPDIHVMKGTASGGGITAWGTGAELTAQPARQAEYNRKFRNVISFYLDENNTTFYLNDFTASIDLTIEYKTSPTGLALTFDRTLTLDYKKGEGQLSDVRQYIHFEGAEYVKVIVNNFSFPAASGSLDFKNLLVLENTVHAARYFNITATPFTVNQPINIPSGNILATGSDILNVSWSLPVNGGHNAIQLEWAWLENELETNYYVSGSFNNSSKQLLLDEGSTRVELGYASTSYKIPMLYDGNGKLHYRVRGVNFKENGTRINGVWSTIQTVEFTGHNNKLNWQSTNEFADEGKHKSVIQYFDGSFRARQFVTKDHIAGNTIISESIYDREGRAVLQILPAPGIGNIIAYQKNLNKFNGQSDNQDPTEFFDWHLSSGTGTPALQTNTGSSSNYYSPSNPDQSGANKYLPDAEGYPYSITRFYPDGSGRVQSQSGVGMAMKMGSGHEIKYYYGSPTQEELDALFGTEVGDKSHYFKNMVRDANGQMSVSYVDMHGRTIATSLAGESPANLNSLDVTNAAYYPNQNHTSSLTLNLLDNNTNIVKENAIEAVSTLLVPYNTIYTFSYTLTPESLSLPVCNDPAPVCYECLYDLEFVVMDESGDIEQPVIRKKYSNLSVDFDSLCSTSTRLFLDSSNVAGPRVSSISFAETLQAGSYSVRKTLTISEKSLAFFKENYLTKGVCNLDLTFLIDSVYQELKALTHCDNPSALPLSCTTCNDSLGSHSQFETRFLNSIGHQGPVTPALAAQITAAYREAKENCDLLCGNSTLETLAKRELMLGDMSPYGGQYATELVPFSSVGSKYHIFSTAYPSTQPFFRKPKNSAGLLDVYYTSFNDTDRTVHPLPPATLYSTLNTMSSNSFSQQFQDKWAESLLPYHPEYTRLLFAETTLGASYNWISNFNTPQTYAAAQTAGYIYTNNLDLTDPFFSVPNTGGKKSVMVNWLNNDYRSGLSLWQYAFYTAVCPASPTWPGCSNPSSIPKTPVYAGLSVEQSNRLWLRFRNLYLEARNQLMDAFIAEERPLPGSDETDLVSAGYILRFPRNHQQQAQQYGNNSENPGDWSFWPPSPGAPPVLPVDWNTSAGQAGDYSSQCQSYVPQWKEWLLQCPSLANHPNSTVILNSLTTRMVYICVKGSDQANPSGSSTVRPSLPADGSFRSFEQLIQHVYDSLGIAKTDRCNPFVIEYPKPYGKGTAVTPQIVTTVDSCNCARFAEIKVEAINAGKNPAIRSSLNEYLLQHYQDTISASLFDALNRCNELNIAVISNCDSLFTTVIAPCASLDPCGLSRSSIREEKKVLGLDKEGSGIAQKVLPPGGGGEVEPQFCLEPYVWDPILRQCVMPGLECPPGYTWDPWYQQCVYTGNPPACPPGYQWDPYWGDCRPIIIIEDCEFNCYAGMACDTVKPTHISLAEPAMLPSFMQCGYTGNSRCVTCTDLQGLVSSFKTYFPSPYNTAPVTGSMNLDSTQTAYNRNLARFLNFRTGFSFTWAEYMKVVDSTGCNLSSGGTQTVICRDTKPLTDTTGIFVQEDPCQRTYDMALHIAQELYQFRLQWLLADFEKRYRAKCMAASKLETFTVSYIPKEYHYVLYYYDQAGNLVKTVPPAGVRPDYGSGYLADVKAKRAIGATRVPVHEKLTQYRFNSLNRVVLQQTPDGGSKRFWYDRLCRLVASQNDVQLPANKYSYSIYDFLGRTVEVGQKHQASPISQAITQDETLLLNWLSSGGVREQVNYTVYDESYSPVIPDPEIGYGISQKNLRNRVSYSMFKNVESDNWHYTGTFYTYDVNGNVRKILQDYRGVANIPGADRLKNIAYSYDIISGKINEVAYQHGASDAFYHRYNYDWEDRVVNVETSRDRIYWERDASYEYYRHGPISRTTFGHLQVQGLDYAYTVEGWLKGLNSTSLTPSFDIGLDGFTTGSVNPVARDIYGFSLHYFDDGAGLRDYKPIGGGNPFARPVNNDFRSLYSGNIAAVTLNNGALKKGSVSVTNSLPFLYNYRYDQLNRLVNVQVYKGLNEATNAWMPIAIDDYKERITYDPNGNIRNYIRYGAPSLAGMSKMMDSLNYTYYPDNNRLQRVNDDPSFSGYYPDDIDNQTESENYLYDAAGNLVTDKSEGISSVSWSAYGKISSLTKNGVTTTYTYDAAGNRITKTTGGLTTLYVKDANGNTRSIYEISATGSIDRKETHLYGSSKIGSVAAESKPPVTQTIGGGLADGKVRTLVRGEKSFELGNHLQNILAIVTDKKISVDQDNDGRIDFYQTDVVAAQDYFPFGMNLPGRTVDNNSIKYGFNAHEKSSEVNGNSYTAEYWQYDSRIARRWNMDPIQKDYESPYSTYGGNPIINIDPDGADTVDIIRKTTFDKRQYRAPAYSRAGLDFMQSKIIDPGNSGVTVSGDISIVEAPGVDVFRFTDIKATIDANGVETITSTTTTTLDIRGTYEGAFRNPGRNVKEYRNDIFALAGMAPDWLLDHYSAKNDNRGTNRTDVDWPTWRGVLEAKALQSEIPFANRLNQVMTVAYTVSGIYGLARGFLTRNVAGIGFNSFNEFKKAYGTAGTGKAWHHIVEQNPGNIAKFGAQRIHNTANLIKVEHGAGTLHAKVSGYYSSIQPFSNGQTVRQWLSSQTYKQQYDFGIKILKQYGWTP